MDHRTITIAEIMSAGTTPEPPPPPASVYCSADVPASGAPYDASYDPQPLISRDELATLSPEAIAEIVAGAAQRIAERRLAAAERQHADERRRQQDEIETLRAQLANRGPIQETKSLGRPRADYRGFLPVRLPRKWSW